MLINGTFFYPIDYCTLSLFPCRGLLVTPRVIGASPSSQSARVNPLTSISSTKFPVTCSPAFFFSQIDPTSLLFIVRYRLRLTAPLYSAVLSHQSTRFSRRSTYASSTQPMDLWLIDPLSTIFRVRTNSLAQARSPLFSELDLSVRLGYRSNPCSIIISQVNLHSLAQTRSPLSSELDQSVRPG